MKRSTKFLIIGLIAGVGIFGYTQYAAASQIDVVIAESWLLESNGDDSHYGLQLEFDNPSLLMLTAGQTEFEIVVDDERLGDGTLQPFVLSALDKTLVDGTFVMSSDAESDDAQSVRITGITKYDLLMTSIDVPFVFYPTEDQAREFIQHH